MTKKTKGPGPKTIKGVSWKSRNELPATQTTTLKKTYTITCPNCLKAKHHSNNQSKKYVFYKQCPYKEYKPISRYIYSYNNIFFIKYTGGLVFLYKQFEDDTNPARPYGMEAGFTGTISLTSITDHTLTCYKIRFASGTGQDWSSYNQSYETQWQKAITHLQTHPSTLIITNLQDFPHSIVEGWFIAKQDNRLAWYPFTLTTNDQLLDTMSPLTPENSLDHLTEIEHFATKQPATYLI